MAKESEIHQLIKHEAPTKNHDLEAAAERNSILDLTDDGKEQTGKQQHDSSFVFLKIKNRSTDRYLESTRVGKMPGINIYNIK